MKDIIGNIALCGHNKLGVITGYDHQHKIWTGYQIEKNPGSRWESKDPRIIIRLEKLKELPNLNYIKDLSQLSLDFE